MKKLLQLIFLAFLLYSCTSSESNNNNNNNTDVIIQNDRTDSQRKENDGEEDPQNDTESTSTEDTEDSKEVNNTPKTDSEVLADAAVELGEIISEQIKEQRRKDSIFMANRGEIWVYRIGYPTNDKDELRDSYKPLKNINGFYAFKEKDRFHIIKMKSWSQQQMIDSLDVFKKKLKKFGINGAVEVINLMTFCNKKETVVQGSKVKIRHDDDVPCYVCD